MTEPVDICKIDVFHDMVVYLCNYDGTRLEEVPDSIYLKCPSCGRMYDDPYSANVDKENT